MHARIINILQQLTLAEKARLLTGRDYWRLEPVEKAGLPSITLSDGPHGLALQKGGTDPLGGNDSAPATSYPTASCSACSFDEALLYRMGEALGTEAHASGVSVLLGPGVCMKRSPLCGRNFEYFSEDPYLSGKLAAAYIRGVQSKGVGTSLKHYAANNQEYYRLCVDSQVDERALREVYLKAFEIAVKESRPWTLMPSYNKVNGVHSTDNRWLLDDVGRREFGFEGLYVSDWNAMYDSVESARAGLDLEMPGVSKGRDEMILAAIRRGDYTEAELDERAGKVLELIMKAVEGKKHPVVCDMAAHSTLAREVAENSAVLLKNDGILPLKRGSLAVIGRMAKTPRYQGLGSSRIHPYSLDSICEALDGANMSYEYADGYRQDAREPDETLIAQAVEAACGKEAVLLVVGLPEIMESEGYDRKDMAMPAAHTKLIEAVAAVNPNTAVMLQCGAPVEMEWESCVKAVLLMYLSGSSGGAAAVNLLMGKANPSGALAETWPFCARDVPANKYFANDTDTVQYRESLYIGYRYFDTANAPARYPFGYGLSYTTFVFEDMSINRAEWDGGGQITVTVTLRNTGKLRGGQAVQLYVAQEDPVIFKPKKELKAFAKVWLDPGESREVLFQLNRDAFQYFNPESACWAVEGGTYSILTGASVMDIRQKVTLRITADLGAKPLDLRPTLPAYYDIGPGFAPPETQYMALLGHALPPPRPRRRPFTPDSPLSDLQGTLIGRLLEKMGKKIYIKMVAGDPKNPTEDEVNLVAGNIRSAPLRQLCSLGLSKVQVSGVVDFVNGYYLRGLYRVLGGQRGKKSDGEVHNHVRGDEV